MRCYIDSYFKVGCDYKVKDLLEYVGISREAYNNILKSESMPRVDIAIKICQFFCELSPDGEWDVEGFWK